MRDTLFAYEPLIRLAAFAGVFVAMAAWEFLTPRRPQAIARNWRWPNNVGVGGVDVLLVRILLPITAVGLSLAAEAHGFGLFHVIGLPTWASIIVSVILLDLAIYLQHVLFHAVPALWRLHRMHHADLEVQPQQRPRSSANRSGAALVCRDAGHASRASFDPAARDQQQFRVQPPLVGSSVGHLPRGAYVRPRGHDDWD